MKIGTLDFTAYSVWYAKEVPSGMALFGRENVANGVRIIGKLYSDNHSEPGYHIHTIDGSSLGAFYVPARFISGIRELEII